jgi:hypothetical protein
MISIAFIKKILKYKFQRFRATAAVEQRNQDLCQLFEQRRKNAGGK